MVTLVLIVMCGMLGLAVDLGWAYYVKKSAQAAVDAGSISAIVAAYDIVGQIAPASCANLPCQPITPCPASVVNPSTVIEVGCAYAAQNGFSVGGNNGYQNVTLASGDTTPPPTYDPSQYVNVDYWVTARANEQIPQLFSAVMNNFWGNSSARATAALADGIVEGSLWALNWRDDLGFRPRPSRGLNFEEGVGIHLNGNGVIDAGGSIRIASTADGRARHYAGETDGNPTVKGSDIYIQEGGAVDHLDDFDPDPTSTGTTLDMFVDPMRGKGQPSAPTASDVATEYPWLNGQINGDCDAGGVNVLSGRHYAVNDAGNATGEPIRVSGCVQFTGGGPGGFGNYVFYGGLWVPGTNTTVTFSPGRYVMAGALRDNAVFWVHNGNYLTDLTPLGGDGNAVENTDAGEIFIFTDLTYPGMRDYLPPKLNGVLLQHGYVEVKTGNSDGSEVNLHGLNRDLVSDDLDIFAPTLFWMDQSNSRILYDPDGNILTNPGCTPEGNLADPCANPLDPNLTNPFMAIGASSNMDLYGYLYMPRGSYLDMQGSPDFTSPLKIIAGAINIGGTGDIIMLPMNDWLMRRFITLIE